MSGKHAYLIMVHHRSDLLSLLLEAIDDERNDIFIHIDKKAKEQFDVSTERARLHFTKTIDVHWGGYSQIEATYILLKEAVKEGAFSYYHLLTGATYPLKSQNELHAFFDKYEGKEFIGYVNEEVEHQTFERVRYHTLFPESGIKSGFQYKLLQLLRRIYYNLQKALSIDHFKEFNMVYKKGLAYWSITDELARYIIAKEKDVNKMLRNSISGDEVFVQTLAYNSSFRSNIYNMGDEWEGSMREAAWQKYGNRPNHDFIMEDIESLLSCNKCFALKFEGKDGKKIIEAIKKRIL